MKKKTIFVWLLLLLLIGSGLYMLAHNFSAEGPRAVSMMDMPRHHGPFMKRAEGPMTHGVFIKQHHIAFHAKPFHGWMLWGWAAFLVQLLMTAAGIVIWKAAKPSSGWKWGGLALACIGIIVLLPKTLLALLAVAAVYVLYKQRKPAVPLRTEPWGEWMPPVRPAEDFLDQWEQNIQKEES